MFKNPTNITIISIIVLIVVSSIAGSLYSPSFTKTAELFFDRRNVFHACLVGAYTPDFVYTILSPTFIAISYGPEIQNQNRGSDFWFAPGPAVKTASDAYRFAKEMVPLNTSWIIWSTPPRSANDVREAEGVLFEKGEGVQEVLTEGAVGML